MAYLASLGFPPTPRSPRLTPTRRRNARAGEDTFGKRTGRRSDHSNLQFAESRRRADRYRDSVAHLLPSDAYSSSAGGSWWPHVFVIGATDGVLPDYRSTSKANLVEERNLMFVAATRASKRLTLVHAPQVLQPINLPVQKALRPSQFLHSSEVRARLLLAVTLASSLGKIGPR